MYYLFLWWMAGMGTIWTTKSAGMHPAGGFTAALFRCSSVTRPSHNRENGSCLGDSAWLMFDFIPRSGSTWTWTCPALETLSWQARSDIPPDGRLVSLGGGFFIVTGRSGEMDPYVRSEKE